MKSGSSDGKVKAEMPEYSRIFLNNLYRMMSRLQIVEMSLHARSQNGQVRGSLHLATGQEALPVGACAALQMTDALTVTYRGHGYVMAKGCNLNAILAEILGKKAGLCGGKGGKMHLTDLKNGLLGANGIVAAGLGTATGAALASWIDGKKEVAMAVFGDGAMNQGHAHEVFNMAGLYKLPIIYLCENNLYAEMTPLKSSSAVTKIVDRMAGYNIHAVEVDGNDVLAVYEVMKEAVAKARSGHGPTFIEAHTYRTCGHYQNDPGTGYRTKKEIQEWIDNSPTKRFEHLLKETYGFTEEDLDNVRELEVQTVNKAFEDTLALPDPDPSDLLEGVYAS